MALLAPSILNADFSDLKGQLRQLELGSADLIHLDVMDGHFVPNMTFGPIVVKSIRKATKLPLDVHLMVEEDALMIDEYSKAGADFITFHYEAVRHHHKYVDRIQSNGVKCGISINPFTTIDVLKDILPSIDLILVMSVNPGFGGQKFIDGILKKIIDLVEIRNVQKLHYSIEVDGGINRENILHCKNAGADIIVAGASIFNSDNITANTLELKNLIR